jgi:hypothetical protein
LQLNPWIVEEFTKTIIIFQFNQLNPSLIDSSTFNYFIITPDEIN